MQNSCGIVLSIAGCVALSGSVASADGPYLWLAATSLNGQPIEGAPASEIEAYAGDTIVAKVYISNWSPNGETISAYQAQLDPSHFTSGDSGRIAPYHYDELRETNTPNRHNAFVDQAEPNFVHSRLNTLAITDSISLGYRWASVLLDAQLGPTCPQDGTKFYAGTVHFQVSSDASGTFELGFIESPDSCGMRNGRKGYIEPIQFRSLTVKVHGADMNQLVDSLSGNNESNHFNLDGVPGFQPQDVAELIRRLNRPDDPIESGSQ